MKETYPISDFPPSEYDELVALWEASVRATHPFLKEGDIAFYKDLVHTYLPRLQLGGVRLEKGLVAGFFAVSEEQLEMLFVHPDSFGKGVGKALLDYVTKELKILKVDVNEENEKARRFYERYGFQVVGRSDEDATGKPYPILHMSL